METQHPFQNGFLSARRDAHFFASPLGRTALGVVVVCIAVLGWRYMQGSGAQFVRTQNEPVVVATPAPDLSSLTAAAADSETATSDLSMVGPAVVGSLVAKYQALKDSGTYTPEAADAAAQQLATQINIPISYKTYAETDIHTSSDLSYQAMLTYRFQLKGALTPLASVKDLELAVFGKYAETKDPAYLDQLRSIVATYTKAISDAASLTVPEDAVSLHAGILNAMGEFGATLEALADNAQDPITVITLLRNYDDAEQHMISSFNALANYFAHHPQP